MAHFIVGVVYCLFPEYMSAAQVVLFNKLAEAGYGIYISGVEKLEPEDEEDFCCEDHDGCLWSFTYCAHDSNAENAIADALDNLVCQNVVFDYTLQYFVLEYFIPNITTSQN